MLPEAVEEYLTFTRGENGFQESHDEDINEFANSYRSTLVNNSIKVVVIDSPHANTEMLICDHEKYLIWDRTFFSSVCSYIFYMLNIQAVYSTFAAAPYYFQKKKCQRYMNALWHCIFKHQIYSISNATTSQKKILDEYCEKCGDSLYGIKYTPIDYKKLFITKYYAKLYIFSHELAHVTYKQDKDYLNTVFDIAQKSLERLPEKPQSYPLIKKQIEQINNSSSYHDSSFYQEIMADTRAVQTTWSRVIFECFGEIKTVFLDNEISFLFPKILEAQDGIDFVRSFLVRSSNLRYIMDGIVSDKADDSVFIDFLIRDYFSNPISTVLLCGFDGGTGRGLEYILKYHEYRSNRNISILDRLFTDEFADHISIIKEKLSPC